MSRVPAAKRRLTDDDYRRLVHVVEAVDRSPDLRTFARRLARAVHHWLGHRAVAVLHGASLDEATRGNTVISGHLPASLAGRDQSQTGDPLRDRRTLQALTDRGVVAVEGRTGEFAVRIDGEPHGAVYLVTVADAGRAPARTTALLHALRRHLAPIAGRLLANDHTPAWQLTPREREVAALVADGLTNQQIAERLVVSVDTVKKHLTRVLAETGCGSRTQLAVRWEQRHAVAALPHQVPPSTGRFVGRTDELAALDLLLAARDRVEPAVAVIEGMAGTGKTSLALRWASLRREAFDLDLFVDLRGCAETEPRAPTDALGLLLRSLGIPAAAIPPELELRAALLRGSLGRRGRALLVLDNARDADQVRPLLPGTGVVVLVTSRTQLRSLVAREGATRVTLREFPETDALELFTALAGRTRTGREPAAAAQLTALCGHLPLAVALAAERAARLEGVPLLAHARELSDERGRLRALRSPADPGTDVAAALSLSVRTLTAGAARLFRFLGMHPGSTFGADAAATALDVSLDEASAALDELVMAHLLNQADPARFRFHDLVRLYARSLTDEAGPHTGARRRPGVGRPGVAAVPPAVRSVHRHVRSRELGADR